jgi:hypothetical protein
MEKAKRMARGGTMRWRVRESVPGLAVVLGLLVLAACSRTPPEQRLREQLGRMQAALEQHDARDFMAGVAADFSGNGGMDRAALQQVVRAQVLVNARIGLTLGPAGVELKGDRATVRFTAAATAGNGRLLPDRAQAWNVTSGWREEDGKWRLYYAEWAPL